MSYSRSAKAILAVAVFSVLWPSATRSFEGAGLLTSGDIEREAKDREGVPALSSALGDEHPWETFNQWMCFDSSQVAVESVGIKIGSEWKSWPEFVATTSGQRFHISPETDLDIDVPKVIEEWGELLKDSKSVCFYSAFLQYFDNDGDDDELPESLWILEDIKSERGYSSWNVD